MLSVILVLTTVNQSQYGTPIFIILNKKGGSIGLMAYFYKLNQQLVREIHSLPITGKKMNKLESFQYENSL